MTSGIDFFNKDIQFKKLILDNKKIVSYCSNPLFVALIIANLFMLVIGWWGNRLFVKVIAIPPAILLALIPAFSVVGSFMWCSGSSS